MMKTMDGKNARAGEDGFMINGKEMMDTKGKKENKKCHH